MELIMRSSPFSFAALLLALPLTAQTAQTEPAAQKHATVGQKVGDTQFPQFINGDGRQNLADFFGQPIVIDEWGTH
jgi:hypothetical protein